ncbi:30S ribosomal protein S4 [bacterium]|nr:30S ribosomal protein S4 [bacterium]
MARYRESVCKICRREGLKLFLKGDRCYKDSCAINRRNFPPGEHGSRMRKKSSYGLQLREKQKVKFMYGLLERQFHLFFKRAEKSRGITGEILLLTLEKRFDNFIYRSNFASSRSQARQLVNHSHFLINGKKVNVPSYIVKQGDLISIKEKSKELLPIKIAMESFTTRKVPKWIELDIEKFTSRVITEPLREDVEEDIKEHLIVELYSK